MKDLMWLEINLKNLASNIKNLRKLLKPKTKFMAVVKANAYGHGMVACAKASLKAGANWLGVVNIKEALDLRKNKIKAPILVLGYVDSRNFTLAANNNISIAIVNWEQLNSLQANAYNLQANFKIHLKIETGINRLGFARKDWPKLIEKLNNLSKNIIIEGVYSHFASVEEHDIDYAKKQTEQFKKFKKLFESNYKSSVINRQVIYHMSASAATMILPESHFDMVRCGISIYGLWPSLDIKNNFSAQGGSALGEQFLKPVLSYKTKIVQIKEVAKGDFIGYGCTYCALKNIQIAALPVGYYEGIDRGLSNLGEALIGGIKCPIVGRICMNMCTVDITKCKKIKIGDEVVLIGKQRSNSISVDDIAKKLDTINYEITTRIPEHVKRVYIK